MNEGGPIRDPHRLDADRNGVACESLPSRVLGPFSNSPDGGLFIPWPWIVLALLGSALVGAFFYRRRRTREGTSASTEPDAQNGPLVVSTNRTTLPGRDVQGFGRSLRRYRVNIVSFNDGDTVTVQVGPNATQKLRLFGIDAPDSGQDLWAQSRAELQRLLVDGLLWAEVMEQQDAYGRPLVLLYEESAREYANVSMVRSGFAYWYRDYAPNASSLEQAENEARRNRNGVWIRPEGGIRPWAYRRGSR